MFWGAPPGGSSYNGGWFPLGATLATDANKFLPAAGYRGGDGTPGGRTNGGVKLMSTHGFYWSSTAYVNNNAGYGFSIGIDAPGSAGAGQPAHLYPVSYNRTLYGFPIRCVHGEQIHHDPITPMLAVNPTSIEFDHTGVLTSATNTVTVTTNQPGWKIDETTPLPAWLSFSTKSGVSGATFTVTATAVITVVSTGGTQAISKTVTVTQSDAPIDPANIRVTAYTNVMYDFQQQT